MSSMTDYLENKLIDFLFRGQAYTPPTVLEFALFTAAPTDAGGGTEVSDGNYSRVPIDATMANFCGTQGASSTDSSSGTEGTTSNNVPITFPAISATCTHVGVFDAHTGGHLLWWTKVSTAKTFSATAPEFSIGSVSFQIDT